MKRNEKSAAERIGLQAKTLANWRSQRRGPPFYKLGSRVVYDDADVDAWLAARRHAGDSGRAAA